MWNGIRTYGTVILAAVGIALFVRQSFFETYRIPSVSMKPTLNQGDTLFVSKISYGFRFPFSESEFLHFGPISRGDVLIYEQTYPTRGQFVKRVLGLPGDRIEIRNGRAILNGLEFRFIGIDHTDCGKEYWDGSPVNAPVLFPVCYGEISLPSLQEKTLESDEYFLISDFRSDFSDSVSFKPYTAIRRSSILGKAVWIWFSTETSRILTKIK